MQLDIVNPKLSEYATSGSLTTNDNIKKSLTIGIILSLVFTVAGVCAFILIDELGWPFMIILGVLFLIYRFFSFNSYLKAYFIDIEY